MYRESRIFLKNTRRWYNHAGWNFIPFGDRCTGLIVPDQSESNQNHPQLLYYIRQTRYLLISWWYGCFKFSKHVAMSHQFVCLFDWDINTDWLTLTRLKQYSQIRIVQCNLLEYMTLLGLVMGRQSRASRLFLSPNFELKVPVVWGEILGGFSIAGDLWSQFHGWTRWCQFSGTIGYHSNSINCYKPHWF